MGARHQRTQRAPQHAHECQRRRLLLRRHRARLPALGGLCPLPARLVHGAAGRQTFTSRLGFAGFDGGRATLRYRKLGLEATGYVGLGLARASSVGVNDPVTAPLGDFIPGERSLHRRRAAWASLAVRSRRAYSGSARSTAPPTTSCPTSCREARWSGRSRDSRWPAGSTTTLHRAGSAALMPKCATPRPRLGDRRVQAVHAALRPVDHLACVFAGAVERRPGLGDQFTRCAGSGCVDASSGTTSRTPAPRPPWAAPTTTGTLWAAGATVTALPRWTFDAGWMYDKNFGAAAAGGDASVGWTPINALVLRLYGAYSQRPLVYRYDDSYVTWAGLDVSLRATQQVAGRGVRRLREREPEATGRGRVRLEPGPHQRLRHLRVQRRRRRPDWPSPTP